MFTLTIDTGNDAFAEADGPQELSRILHQIADKIGESTWLTVPDAGKARDINGNTVGSWEIKA